MTKIYLIIAINIALVAIQFALTSRYSTDGHVLAKLNAQTRTILSENLKLSQSLYELTSLSHINSQAALAAFTPIQVDFSSPPQVASKR